MIQSLCQELMLRAPQLTNQVVDSIYFGGGTPSLLKSEYLVQIFETIYSLFKVNQHVEITLEANPDDIDIESVQQWKQAGINRLSIGIQSFDEVDLKWMNRAHSQQQAEACLSIAQQVGITNISLDLMYGLPEMDNERWLKQINKALALKPTHISAYCLTIEENTALDKMIQQHKIVPASNEQQSEHFSVLITALKKHGFEQYEISNFGLPGFQAVHNSNYWKGIHYIGIGPSAHSFNGISRSWNIANNHQYMKFITQGETWYESEVLSKQNQFNELLLTGLRTSWGVNLEQLVAILPLSTNFSQKLNDFIEKGWMEIHDQSIILTEQGKYWADAIAADLFEM